jgi:signal transduction histidine kinase
MNRIVDDVLARSLSEASDEYDSINQSLERRERLLAATARASRLLLETPNVMNAIPSVLKLLGEAAAVDRVGFLASQRGPANEPLIVLVAEWVGEGVVSHLGNPDMGTHDEREFSAVSAELRAGRTVCFNKEECDINDPASLRISIEGVGTKTKAIVPIFVDNDFVGVLAFDNTRQRRAIDSAELSTLETAAGVVTSALHRERLIDAVRIERERAVEQRMAELAKSNELIRGALERLATQPDLGSFLGHILLETTRQLHASSGGIVRLSDSREEWEVIANVRNGVIEKPSFASKTLVLTTTVSDVLEDCRQRKYLHQTLGEWPGALDYYRGGSNAAIFIFPLTFGDRTVGFFVLGFDSRDDKQCPGEELIVALAQQATLAIELSRLGNSAKRAAVLDERNRIAQEIHDGLAQAFTGILMQLGAAEELHGSNPSSPLSGILTRIRDLAREGLGEARRSVVAMRPDSTPRASFELALRQLAERSTVFGRLTCVFEGGGILTGLLPEHEHELFRIAQEAVSNAVQHAEPRKVKIAMTEELTTWTLRIEDDGRGMQEKIENYARRGFGLTSMRERAKAIGGEWAVESRVNEGTRICVRLAKPLVPTSLVSRAQR